MARHENARRLEPSLRTLRIAAALVTLAVLAGGIHQILATGGAWGRFVPWTVFTIAAAIWPVTFLLAGAASPERRPRLYAAAGLVNVSILGLLPIGWGLVALLDPEHVIGWYLPARGGGSEIDDQADARVAGKMLVVLGGFLGLVVPAVLAALHSASRTTDPTPEPARVEDIDPRAEAIENSSIVLWVAAGLFWLVGLGLGLLAMILPDSVTDRLAQCAPSEPTCATDSWVAGNLPWALTATSLVALLVVFLVYRAFDRIGEVTTLVAGGLLQAGSVVAVAVGLRYMQWQDTTCGSPGYSSRYCGGRDPDFSFADGWLQQTVVLGLFSYAVLAYMVVFPLLARVHRVVGLGHRAESP